MAETPPSTGAEPRFGERILFERLDAIVRQTPQGVVAPAAMATIGAFFLWGRVPSLPLALGVGVLVGALVAWLAFFVGYQRAEPAYDAARLRRAVLARTAAHGIAWGVLSLCAFEVDSIVYRSVDVAFMYGLVAGAVVVDGPYFPAFAAFALPTLLPVVVRSLLEGTGACIAIGSAGLVGLAHGLYAAQSASRLTETSLRGRLENLELLRELERQRLLAEQARREAEAANRDKSRFLAAASHDLRQPVHALGLLTAAARHASDAERQAIVARVDATVASLSSLFDSLLDLSQLEARVVTPGRVPLRLDAFLERLADEFRLDARARGLRLRVRSRELWVSSDPLLLERLVRNLVTNALRYTSRGGVLLAARRRGAAAWVEVWDTGAGIATPQLAKIFEPFYQVAGPGRGTRDGVGLGLAIVQRIAALLEHRLSVRSRQGRGSCFRVELPLAVGAELDVVPTHGTHAPLVTELLGAVVVVIDDAEEVLEAVGLLLGQWGCLAVSAPSAEHAAEMLATSALEPDVVVSDFRLAGGASGLEAVRLLREGRERPLPAVIVTADTSEERLAELAASGLPFLHKPVRPHELAGMLRRLLTSDASSRPS